MNKKTVSHVSLFSLIVICMTACFVLVYAPRPALVSHAGISDIAVLEDASGAMKFSEAIQNSDAFLEQDYSTVFRKRSSSAFWIRCTIAKPTNVGVPRFLSLSCPNMEELDVFFQNGSVIKAGKMVDVRKIPIRARDWFFPIPAELDETTRAYIRIHSSTVLNVPIKVVDLKTMVNEINRDMIFFGIFFGILLAVLCTNLFSYFILKKDIFLIYSAYLLFLILYNFRVHGFLYLFRVPFPVSEAFVWITLGGFIIFMIHFAQRFMDLRHRLPIFNALLNGAIVVVAVQTAIGVFVSRFIANTIGYTTGFFIPIAIIATVIYLYLKGYSELRYYLIAWGALLSATVIWSIMPRARSYVSPSYIFMAGTSIDSLLFTLSIFELIRKDLREKDEIKEREKYYITLSRTDPLTGLYNRRYLNDIVKRLEADDEMPSTSSLFMLDLDQFKQINDTYGHLVGDILLTRTGSTIKSHIRHTDIACRYGGDEFLVLLPGAGLEAARNIAESIRQDVLKDITYSETGDEIHHTISIGITETRLEDSFDGMFLRADAALYQAKKMGRNRITIL